ncbi:MAG: 23S rRNA (guanosine(2251)-2'-O)-methyltransferase RlmB [Bacteroidia bacterium]|nr:23S rRNA (guanosine(2251)-2'-O)-methyltransferase RlmB [Bacteroidia bacterium]
MRERQKQPNNLIYGIHSVLEALEAGKPVDKIMIRQGNIHGRIGEIRSRAKDLQIPVQMVPDATIERICPPGSNHQGLAAFISAVEYQPLEEIILGIQERGETPLLLLLDSITDVRNFGAIARTAECLGVHALVVPAQGAAAINADAVKVSAGALHHLPVCRVNNLVDAVMLMQAYGIATIACTEKAEASIYDMDFRPPMCLIMGAEDKGISTTLLKRAGFLAQIPMYGKISSLNVSVAAGVIMAEARRQRG